MQTDIASPRVPTGAPPEHLLGGASLFLDFDGTLVELADRPDAVRVGAHLQGLLVALAERLDGRLAIVSGRSADAIGALLGESAAASLPMVVGSHGLEFRYADGRRDEAERPQALAAIRERMDALGGAWPGLLVEDKPLGAALHYRMCPDAENACHELAAELAGDHGLHLQTGKMMIEVRAGGADKGSAIRRLMDEPALRGTHPVFLGDDDTDEPGFAAAAELGGAGVLVGPPRASAARYRLDGVEAVIGWLERACRA